MKSIDFRDPRINQWTYYIQSSPVDGEMGAPKRLEATVAPWFKEMDFNQGQHERSCFYHTGNDLRILLYEADCLVDGDTADVQWIFEELEKKFKCKSLDVISDLTAQEC